MAKIEFKTVVHQVGFNDTVEAIIRSYNHQAIDKKILGMLVNRFYELNTEAHPPKVGQRLQIPIMLGFEGRRGSNINT